MTTQAQIFEFITTHLNANGDLQFDPALNLLESGLIDSVAMIDLIVWLEEKYQISICTDDLVPENFGTLDAIAAYISRSGAPV